MTELRRPTSEDERESVSPLAARPGVSLTLVTGIDEELDRAVADALRSLSRPDRPLAASTGTEAERLSALNERLLAATETLGEASNLADLSAQARAALRAARRSGAGIVAGSTFAPLFDFWRALGEIELRPVLCVPALRSFDRARAREGDRRISALAAYEAYHRAALEQLEDAPVFVLSGARLTKEPALVLCELLEFVSPGAALDRERVTEVAARLATALASDDDASASDEDKVLGPLLELGAQLDALGGAHEMLGGELLEDPNPWAATVVELERDLEHLTSALLWSHHQIEPMLRSEAGEARPPSEAERVEEDEPDEGEDFKEPSIGGPYPLSASEDRRSYHRWLSAHRLPITVGGPSDPVARRASTRRQFRRRREPLISVLVPVWKTPLWALERCVGSVLRQEFANWELCICDDASNDPDLSAYLKSLHRVDRRIQVCALGENAGISAATNAALALARGRYVTFLDHDDELSPDALGAVAGAIEEHPDAEVLYSDEDKIDGAGERFDPHFKPEWSPDLLMSFAYLCHLTVVRRDLVVSLGGLRSEFDGSQDYDLSLRATERASEVVHIPRVLYHWRTLPGSAATDSPGAIAKPWAYEAGRRALEDALRRRGERGEVTLVDNFPGRYAVRRRHEQRPLVSIIIPFRDEPRLLASCASSLRSDPGYDRIELLLVDNDSQLPETHALLDRLGEEEGVRIIPAPGRFNWAAINNAAVHEARGELLLFANNDIEARVPGWLDAMVSHALRGEVGAVGARLLYPDGAIQHAGVVIGLGGIAGHVLRGLPGEVPGYGSIAIATRNCSVVTGACMMVRREVFEEVGGFDEDLPVAFNDVDFCLKLRELGYLVVYTPQAELIHHESRSRGHTDDLAESRRIVARWRHAIAAGDPYHNVNLSHWRYWCPLSTQQEEDRWKNYLETSVLMRASSWST